MVPNGFLGQTIDGRWERSEPIGSTELAELTKNIYKHVIESFGPERSMWESNFPVVRFLSSAAEFLPFNQQLIPFLVLLVPYRTR
jgi:hypothetical protein